MRGTSIFVKKSYAIEKKNPNLRWRQAAHWCIYFRVFSKGATRMATRKEAQNAKGKYLPYHSLVPRMIISDLPHAKALLFYDVENNTAASWSMGEGGTVSLKTVATEHECTTVRYFRQSYFIRSSLKIINIRVFALSLLWRILSGHSANTFTYKISRRVWMKWLRSRRRTVQYSCSISAASSGAVPASLLSLTLLQLSFVYFTLISVIWSRLLLCSLHRLCNYQRG